MKLTVVFSEVPHPVTRIPTSLPSASLYDVVVAPKVSDVCATHGVVRVENSGSLVCSCSIVVRRGLCR